MDDMEDHLPEFGAELGWVDRQVAKAHVQRWAGTWIPSVTSSRCGDKELVFLLN